MGLVAGRVPIGRLHATDPSITADAITIEDTPAVRLRWTPRQAGFLRAEVRITAVRITAVRITAVRITAVRAGRSGQPATPGRLVVPVLAKANVGPEAGGDAESQVGPAPTPVRTCGPSRQEKFT